MDPSGKTRAAARADFCPKGKTACGDFDACYIAQQTAEGPQTGQLVQIRCGSLLGKSCLNTFYTLRSIVVRFAES